jgi:protein SCO1/2
MPARARLALVVAAVCAAAIAAVVALAGPARDTAATGPGFAGALRPPGIPVQDFALRDQDGARATLSAYRGRVVVLTFMYSHCRDTCPIQAQQIRGALDDLGRDVPVLAVSVDPGHDTPASARAFVRNQSLTGRMRFLLGRRAQLAPVWRHYGVQPQGHGFEHSASVVLLDRAGRQRIGFPLNQLTPERLAHDIRLLGRERS